MREIQGILPNDLVAEAEDIAQRLMLLRVATEQRVADYVLHGVSPDDQAELEQAAGVLDTALGIGDVVLSTIDNAELLVIREKQEPPTKDETIAIIRRFAERYGGGFTAFELKEHLHNLGVKIPRSEDGFNKLFARWQGEVVASKERTGSRAKWLARGEGDETLHVLARLVTPEEMKEIQAAQALAASMHEAPVRRSRSLASPEPGVEKRAPASTPEYGLDEKEEQKLTSKKDDLIDKALTFVASMTTVRANQIIAAFAQNEGIPEELARETFNEAVREQRLHRDRRGGSLHFSLSPVGRDSNEENSELNGGSPQRAKVEKRLVGKEQDIAVEMLYLFLDRGIEANQKFSNAALAKQLNQKLEGPIDLPTVSRIMRRLSDLNIMNSAVSSLRSTSPNSTSKSKRNALRGGLAAPAVRKLLQTDKGREIIIKCITTNTCLNLEDALEQVS